MIEVPLKSRNGDIGITGKGATRGEALADGVNRAAAKNLSLVGVDLSGLDRRHLQCKDHLVLVGANLVDAQWTDDLVLIRNPIIIGIPKYWPVFILYTDKGTYLQLGCEIHSLETWEDIYDNDKRPISSKVGKEEARRMRDFFEKYAPWFFAGCHL